MGRKEDNIKRATALFTKLEQIRNIGTAAQIDPVSYTHLTLPTKQMV